MASEFVIFEKGGKDQAARRTLFTSFIHLIDPDWKDDDTLNMREVDGHMFGFRKSAGIWYLDDGKYTCWDRRLVFWMRAGKEGFLPFYDVNGDLVTAKGKPLEEAAVCTLEVVLRNQAFYTIGFLLLPKYKRHQVESIDSASSWSVIGYFPFPDPATGARKINGCVIDSAQVKEILLANLPDKKLDQNENGFKRSESPIVDGNMTKRRNIDSKSGQGFKPVFDEKQERSNPTKLECQDDECMTTCSSKMDDLEACFLNNNDQELKECKTKDAKKLEEDFYPVPIAWEDDCMCPFANEFDNMSLFHDDSESSFSDFCFPPACFSGDISSSNPFESSSSQLLDSEGLQYSNTTMEMDGFSFPASSPAYATAAAAAATVATAAAAAAAATAAGASLTPPPMDLPNECNNTENSFSWSYNDMFH